MTQPAMDKIGMGGGCHWCTEAVFLSLKGVAAVEQGWIAAKDQPTFSEAVIVHFNPAEIDLQTLIAVHLRTHSSTAEHGMRYKYRSAIYYFEEVQKQLCLGALQVLQADFDKNIITKVLAFQAFELSSTQYQDYYYKNPEKPFCETHINPKMQTLLQRFAKYADTTKIPSSVF